MSEYNTILEYLEDKKDNEVIDDYAIADIDGGIEILGVMPNTNEYGWFYVGNIDSINIQSELEYFLGR